MSLQQHTCPSILDWVYFLKSYIVLPLIKMWCSPVTPNWFKSLLAHYQDMATTANGYESLSYSMFTADWFHHNQIPRSKRLPNAQMRCSVCGSQEGELLHRSESQQWIRTPGSSCCWQCLEVAQPLVRTIPRAVLSVLMQKRCLKPLCEWVQVMTSGLVQPTSTYLWPWMMLQP